MSNYIIISIWISIAVTGTDVGGFGAKEKEIHHIPSGDFWNEVISGGSPKHRSMSARQEKLPLQSIEDNETLKNGLDWSQKSEPKDDEESYEYEDEPIRDYEQSNSVEDDYEDKKLATEDYDYYYDEAEKTSSSPASSTRKVEQEDNDMFHNWGLEGSIPGVPEADYPVYVTVPQTGFRCENHPDPGFYGDVDARCQVFHICQEDGRHHSFLCPVGTVFNQKHFVCDWWFRFNCTDSRKYYHLNSLLYKISEKDNQHKRKPAYFHRSIKDQMDKMKHFMSGGRISAMRGRRMFRSNTPETITKIQKEYNAGKIPSYHQKRTSFPPLTSMNISTERLYGKGHVFLIRRPYSSNRNYNIKSEKANRTRHNIPKTVAPVLTTSYVNVITTHMNFSNVFNTENEDHTSSTSDAGYTNQESTQETGTPQFLYYVGTTQENSSESEISSLLNKSIHLDNYIPNAELYTQNNNENSTTLFSESRHNLAVLSTEPVSLQQMNRSGLLENIHTEKSIPGTTPQESTETLYNVISEPQDTVESSTSSIEEGSIETLMETVEDMGENMTESPAFFASTKVSTTYSVTKDPPDFPLENIQNNAVVRQNRRNNGKVRRQRIRMSPKFNHTLKRKMISKRRPEWRRVSLFRPKTMRKPETRLLYPEMLPRMLQEVKVRRNYWRSLRRNGGIRNASWILPRQKMLRRRMGISEMKLSDSAMMHPDQLNVIAMNQSLNDTMSYIPNSEEMFFMRLISDNNNDKVNTSEINFHNVSDEAFANIQYLGEIPEINITVEEQGMLDDYDKQKKADRSTRVMSQEQVRNPDSENTDVPLMFPLKNGGTIIAQEGEKAAKDFSEEDKHQRTKCGFLCIQDFHNLLKIADNLENETGSLVHQNKSEMDSPQRDDDDRFSSFRISPLDFNDSTETNCDGNQGIMVGSINGYSIIIDSGSITREKTVKVRKCKPESIDSKDILASLTAEHSDSILGAKQALKMPYEETSEHGVFNEFTDKPKNYGAVKSDRGANSFSLINNRGLSNYPTAGDSTKTTPKDKGDQRHSIGNSHLFEQILSAISSGAFVWPREENASQQYFVNSDKSLSDDISLARSAKEAKMYSYHGEDALKISFDNSTGALILPSRAEDESFRFNASDSSYIDNRHQIEESFELGNTSPGVSSLGAEITSFMPRESRDRLRHENQPPRAPKEIVTYSRNGQLSENETKANGWPVTSNKDSGYFSSFIKEIISNLTFDEKTESPKVSGRAVLPRYSMTNPNNPVHSSRVTYATENGMWNKESGKDSPDVFNTKSASDDTQNRHWSISDTEKSNSPDSVPNEQNRMLGQTNAYLPKISRNTRHSHADATNSKEWGTGSDSNDGWFSDSRDLIRDWSNPKAFKQSWTPESKNMKADWPSDSQIRGRGASPDSHSSKQGWTLEQTKSKDDWMHENKNLKNDWNPGTEKSKTIISGRSWSSGYVKPKRGWSSASGGDAQSWRSNAGRPKQDTFLDTRASRRYWTSESKDFKSDWSSSSKKPVQDWVEDDADTKYDRWSDSVKRKQDGLMDSAKSKDDDWSSDVSASKLDWSSDISASKLDWSSDAAKSDEKWPSDAGKSKQEWASDSQKDRDSKSSKGDWLTNSTKSKQGWPPQSTRVQHDGMPDSNTQRRQDDWLSDSRTSGRDWASASSDQQDWQSKSGKGKQNWSSDSRTYKKDWSSSLKSGQRDWSRGSVDSKVDLTTGSKDFVQDWNSGGGASKLDWSSDSQTGKRDWSSNSGTGRRDWSSDLKPDIRDLSSDSKTDKNDWSSDPRPDRDWSDWRTDRRDWSNMQAGKDDWSFEPSDDENVWSSDSRTSRDWPSDSQASKNAWSSDSRSSKDWSSDSEMGKRDWAPGLQTGNRDWSSDARTDKKDWSSSPSDTKDWPDDSVTGKKDWSSGARTDKKDWSSSSPSDTKDWPDDSVTGKRDGSSGTRTDKKDWSSSSPSDKKGWPDDSATGKRDGSSDSKSFKQGKRFDTARSKDRNENVRQDWSSRSKDSNKDRWFDSHVVNQKRPSGSENSGTSGFKQDWTSSRDSGQDADGDTKNSQRDWSSDSKSFTQNTRTTHPKDWSSDSSKGSQPWKSDDWKRTPKHMSTGAKGTMQCRRPDSSDKPPPQWSFDSKSDSKDRPPSRRGDQGWQNSPDQRIKKWASDSVSRKNWDSASRNPKRDWASDSSDSQRRWSPDSSSKGKPDSLPSWDTKPSGRPGSGVQRDQSVWASSDEDQDAWSSRGSKKGEDVWSPKQHSTRTSVKGSGSRPPKDKIPNGDWKMSTSWNSRRNEWGSPVSQMSSGSETRTSLKGGQSWNEEKGSEQGARDVRRMTSKGTADSKPSWSSAADDVKNIRWSIQIGEDGKLANGWVPITGKPRRRSNSSISDTSMKNSSDQSDGMKAWDPNTDTGKKAWGPNTDTGMKAWGPNTDTGIKAWGPDTDTGMKAWGPPGMNLMKNEESSDQINGDRSIASDESKKILRWIPSSSEKLSELYRSDSRKVRRRESGEGTGEWSARFDFGSTPKSGWIPILNIKNYYKKKTNDSIDSNFEAEDLKEISEKPSSKVDEKVDFKSEDVGHHSADFIAPRALKKRLVFTSTVSVVKPNITELSEDGVGINISRIYSKVPEVQTGKETSIGRQPQNNLHSTSSTDGNFSLDNSNAKRLENLPSEQDSSLASKSFEDKNIKVIPFSRIHPHLDEILKARSSIQKENSNSSFSMSVPFGTNIWSGRPYIVRPPKSSMVILNRTTPEILIRNNDKGDEVQHQYSEVQVDSYSEPDLDEVRYGKREAETRVHIHQHKKKSRDVKQMITFTISDGRFFPRGTVFSEANEKLEENSREKNIEVLNSDESTHLKSYNVRNQNGTKEQRPETVKQNIRNETFGESKSLGITQFLGTQNKETKKYSKEKVVRSRNGPVKSDRSLLNVSGQEAGNKIVEYKDPSSLKGSEQKNKIFKLPVDSILSSKINRTKYSSRKNSPTKIFVNSLNTTHLNSRESYQIVYKKPFVSRNVSIKP